MTVGGKPGRRKQKDPDSSPAARIRAVRKPAAVGLPPTTGHGDPIPPSATADGSAEVDRNATVVSSPGFDISEFRSATAREMEAGTTIETPRATTPPEREEWYLADDYAQYGPMTFSELVARIRRRELGPNPQVWREGLEEWTDLDQIPELRPHLRHLPPPRRQRSTVEAPVATTAPPPRGAPEPATPATSGAAAASSAFFGTTALEEPVEHPPDASLPGPAAVPLPAPQARDRSSAVVLIVAFASIAVVGLVVLAIYLLGRQSESPKASKPAPTAVAQAQTPRAPRPAAVPRPTTPRTAPSPAPQEQDDDELVMPAVTIELGAKKPRRGPAARPRRAPRDGRPSTGLATTSSFSGPSFSGFGPVGLPTRRSELPRASSAGSSPSTFRRGTRKVTKPEVVAVIRRHVHRLKRCYERAVRLHPTELRRAKMKVTIRIGASGRVRSVRITPGKYRGLSLGDCIVSSIKRWRFPPSTESYGTSFPLSFVGR